MREAIGGSLLMYLTVFIVGIIIVFFVGILSYAKAYKVKNRIIEIIEKYGNYEDSETDIASYLNSSGYNISGNNLCGDVGDLSRYGINEKVNLNIANNSSYSYCVYESTNTTDKDKKKNINKTHYYVVVTFVHFEFPIIGGIINIPVYSETKMLGYNNKYDY